MHHVEVVAYALDEASRWGLGLLPFVGAAATLAVEIFYILSYGILIFNHGCVALGLVLDSVVVCLGLLSTLLAAASVTLSGTQCWMTAL